MLASAAWFPDPRCTLFRPPTTRLSLISMLMSLADVLPTPIRTVPSVVPDAGSEAGGLGLGSWPAGEGSGLKEGSVPSGWGCSC